MTQDVRPNPPGRDRRRLAVALLVGLALVGCNDNSGTSGDPCFEFRPLGVPNPTSVTAAEGLGSTCDIAVVDLIVTDVSNLYAATFEVNYDATRVNLGTVSTTNSTLSSDGAPLLRQVTSVASGRILIAITRSQTTVGVDVQGGAVLATLTFFRTGTSGTSTLTFSNAQLLDPSTPPQPIPGIVFVGGSFALFES